MFEKQFIPSVDFGGIDPWLLDTSFGSSLGYVFRCMHFVAQFLLKAGKVSGMFSNPAS